MRLIDADALGRYLNYWRYGDFSDAKHEREYAVLSEVMESVEHAPTVEPIKVGDVCKECWRDDGNVVEVVRCKNCKHWDGVPADETQDHECHLFDGNEEKIRIATPSDWFCPMGERRSE